MNSANKHQTDDSVNPALKYRWRIFWVLALGYVLVYFHRLCPAVVAVDMMADLKTTGGLLGFLGSAYFYPYALMQFPAGLLSDSWGPRKTVTAFFLVAVVGSIIFGTTDSVAVAILGRGLVGVGVAMLFVPTMKVLAEWFKPEEFAFMTGILMAMGGIGSLIATTPLAWMSGMVGWRGSMIIMGLATLALSLLVWMIVRDRPSDMGWESPVTPKKARGETIGLRQGLGMVLREKHFWPLAGWFTFGCGVFFGFIGLWAGPYLHHVYGMSDAQSGNVIMMAAFGMVIGSPLQSYFSNRVFKARKTSLILSSCVTLILTTCLAFATDSIPVWGLYILCFVMGMFTSAIVAVGFTTAKELFPVSMAGTSTGLVNLFPFLAGAVMQPLMGYLLEMGGKTDAVFTIQAYRYAFVAPFVSALLALVCSLFVKETLVVEANE